VGEYVLCLVLTDDDTIGSGGTKNTEVCLNFEIIGINTAPEWTGSFEDTELAVGESVTYYAPKYEDPDVLDMF
jgi:hypothetical protein